VEDADLIVIGGGTAGLAVARAARRRGASVVMVTDGPPGGDCTFTGCVPSKTLIASAHLGFPQAMARVRETVVAIAADESEAVLEREGIGVFRARAVVLDPQRVEVNGLILRTTRLVIATGSGPIVPDVPGLRESPYLTNETLFELTALPEHLVVLGGGAIGCEMAQAFRRLGARVTLLESSDSLLGKEERVAGEVVGTALAAAGIDVRLRTELKRVTGAGTALALETTSGSLTCSHLLVAVGRRPFTGGTEALGLRCSDSGAIEVDARMRTSVKGVFAAGDVTGRLPFTHAADEMGRVAVGNAFGGVGKVLQVFKEDAIPWVTFTDPEVARVGLTEAQAAERHKGARVVELPMSAVDRARTSDRTDGFVKVVVGPRRVTGNAGGGRVLGATIVAERAGEMIAEIALAMRTGMLTGRLAQTSHAYPTWSVAVQQAVGQLFGVGERAPRDARADA
jgi:pyruvate/2-oxoglutarate dehydrogenase complex dihydrolipoamide dehydrogenase (E3) component